MGCFNFDGTPKNRYESEAEAIVAADYAIQARGVDLRPYKCRGCGGWHLTSAPQQKDSSRRRGKRRGRRS